MGIFEFLYYLGYSAKKHYAFKHQKRLPHKVISIGNITTGGTGKTPAAIAIAEEAKKRGFYPIILTRGYKGNAKGPVLVHRASCIMYGDEPVLMSERLKDVPVVKCADRYKGGLFALHSPDSPIHRFTDSPILFILDDGFQHWRLFRDKNILLIDSENPFGNKRLLPAGILREPLGEIKRADIIALTKTDDIKQALIDKLIKEIKQYNQNAPIFLAAHKPLNFISPSGKVMPLEWTEGKNFFAFCGIGNPKSFRKTISTLKGKITGLKSYRDHHRYKQSDIEDILKEAKKSNADWIITTEKDLIRLKGLKIPENLAALTIEFSIDEEFYNEAFN